MTPLKALASLIGALSTRRKGQLVATAALMLVSALCEVATIGTVLPFLTLLAAPDQVVGQGWYVTISQKLGIGTGADLRLVVSLLFATAATLSAIIRVLLIYCLSKLNSGIGHDLAVAIFQSAIGQPYEVQLSRNSSEVLAGIYKCDEATGVIFAALNGLSAAITAAFVVVTLLIIDPYVASGTFLVLGGLYLLLALVAKKKLITNSILIAKAYNARVKSVQEVLGGIRDVLLGQTQRLFTDEFSMMDRIMREACTSNGIIGPSPRHIIEGLGMVLIAGLGYYWSTRSGSGIVGKLPTLGALALGMQRLMPLIQQVYQGFVIFKGSGRCLCDITHLVQPPPVRYSAVKDKLPFARQIAFEGVSFSYERNLRPTLLDLRFTIRKGQRVGIIGATGSGKSTAADLIMGLLEPKVGQITVDGTPLVGKSRLAWQRNIAHVPQAIFLSDASFAENIAFGVSKFDVDLERVRSAAKQAQLADFIEEQPNMYESIIGERGIRLSGGQRQRIAIARALYKGASVLVFDEATSALDDETETAVMEAIDSLGRDLTVVMIAHRLRTLRNCDVVMRLNKGRLVEVGTYQEVVEQKVGRFEEPGFCVPLGRG